MKLLHKIRNIGKVIFNTHKIKSRKEYGFLKQKNNRNGFNISFSVLKIHTLSEDDNASHQLFKTPFHNNTSVERKIKK
ncbi:MAG: hypothetical protein B7Y83_14660 [Flavobacteriales bacterium 32-34-25]|nr:MAG: hypothetical protein B7Y83_14660 [Flavobacteriales bacterium 32-34-25]